MLFEDVTKQLDQFDNDLQDFKAQQLIEKVAKASRSINTASTTKEVTSSIADTNVAEVTVQVEATVDSSVVNEATEEITTTVAESNVSEVTEEVVAVVEESNIAEQVQETTKEVEEIIYTFTNASTAPGWSQDLVFTAEDISKAQLALIDAGILEVSNNLNKDWDWTGTGLNVEILESSTHGLLTVEDIYSLHEELRDHVLDRAVSSGRFDMIAEEAQAQIMCEEGRNVDGNNQIYLGDSKGNIEGYKGNWDCGKL